MRAVWWSCIGTAFLTSVGAGQQSVVLRGLVVDSVSGAPIANATIDIGSPRGPATADRGGVFRVDGVGAGTYTLQVAALGFATKAFRFAVPTTAAGDFDLGVVGLAPAVPVTLRLFGVVLDAVSQASISNAAIAIDGEPVARSGGDGRYQIPDLDLAPGPHELTVRRIGFADATFRLTARASGPMEFDVTLYPAAIDLEALVVEAEPARPPARLGDFLRRSRNEMGQFLAPDEVEAIRPDAQRATDILRRIPGVQTIPGSRGRLIRLPRCRFPRYFIDGMPVDVTYVDDILQAVDINAVEVYTGVARIPLELQRFRRARGQATEECGVIVIWTR